jgi:surface antigen
MVQLDDDEINKAIENADSANAQLAVVPADNVVVAKPQLVTTSIKSAKDIKTWTTVAGDTVDGLAVKFGVTSDSIKWSNGLTSNTIAVGKKLVIPPVNGIVYTVKSGDTVESIAAKYSANKDTLIFDNDFETKTLAVGQQILIRDGVQPTVRSNRATIPALGYAIFGGANTYVRGYCTWYAAARAGVPGGWGNANTWHIYAPRSGWTVSTVPRVGAVAQTTAGWAGHVGIVEAVSADGSMIKYSDMNGLAGYNRVGYSDWVPTHSNFHRFIYHEDSLNLLVQDFRRLDNRGQPL